MSDMKLEKFILYTTENGSESVEVFVQNETVWLTQKKMAELFNTTKQNISLHLKNVFKDEELIESSVVKEFLTTADDGKTYKTQYYNLDAIISVGYRVNSKQATSFRKWATSVLRDYITKGFAMDDELLKNGTRFGKDYFRELLERVRSIRTSERHIYLQITDMFKECSIDYDKDSDITRNFYATVQNKFHYAIHGQTAAEKIYTTADKNKPSMGLTTWKNSPNGRVLKSDVSVAKNYLNEEEIKKLERTISSYFDYIENQIEMKNTFTMESLADSVNKFLEFNDFKVLDGLGKVSKSKADTKAFAEYDEFNKIQKIDSDFEKEILKGKSKFKK